MTPFVKIRHVLEVVDSQLKIGIVRLSKRRLCLRGYLMLIIEIRGVLHFMLSVRFTFQCIVKVDSKGRAVNRSVFESL